MLKRFTSGKDVNNNKDNVPDSKKEAGAIRKALNKLLAVGKNKACVTGIAIAYLIVMATSCGKECKLTEKDGYTLDTKECKYTENPVVPPVVVEICEDYTNPDCPNYDPERVAREGLRKDSTEYADRIKQLTGPELDEIAKQNANLKATFWQLAVRGPPFPQTFADSVAGNNNGTQNGGYVFAVDGMLGMSGGEKYPEAIKLYEGIKSAVQKYLANNEKLKYF